MRRRVRRDFHAAWRRVADREHNAWEAYATAAVQARSLNEEAFAALRWAKQTDELLAVAVADRTGKAAADRQDRRRRGLIQA